MICEPKGLTPTVPLYREHFLWSPGLEIATNQVMNSCCADKNLGKEQLSNQFYNPTLSLDFDGNAFLLALKKVQVVEMPCAVQRLNRFMDTRWSICVRN